MHKKIRKISECHQDFALHLMKERVYFAISTLKNFFRFNYKNNYKTKNSLEGNFVLYGIFVLKRGKNR